MFGCAHSMTPWQPIGAGRRAGAPGFVCLQSTTLRRDASEAAGGHRHAAGKGLFHLDCSLFLTPRCIGVDCLPVLTWLGLLRLLWNDCWDPPPPPPITTIVAPAPFPPSVEHIMTLHTSPPTLISWVCDKMLVNYHSNDHRGVRIKDAPKGEHTQRHLNDTLKV